MMPICQYGRCTRASEINIGKLNVKDEEFIGGHWDTTVYLCKKHANKIAKKKKKSEIIWSKYISF